MKHSVTFRLFQKAVALLVGIAFSVAILIFIEIFFRFMDRHGYIGETMSVKYHYPREFEQHDELLGYKPRQNTKASSLAILKKKKLYEVTYSTDEYSGRITPVKNPSKRDNFLLFFGCSFTFGEGVNDNETLPCYLSELAIDYNPYNYGYMGYGPHQMLARLRETDIRKEIEEKKGILIYTFIDDHVNRAIGDLRTYDWGYNSPYYAIDHNGKLIRKGNFTSGRPTLSLIYNIMRKSRIVNFFRINLPLCITDAHIRLTAGITEESYKTFKEKFKSDDFYVIFYPWASSRYAKRMMPYLRRAGIKYLDYSTGLVKGEDHRKYLISMHDGHPGPMLNKIVAERIFQDLPGLKERS